MGVCGDLSKRQHAGARLVRPVEGDDGALVEFGFAILKGAEKRGTAYFWYERLPTEEHNTRSIVLRVRENPREIQIVRQDDVYASAGVDADFTILSRRLQACPTEHHAGGFGDVVQHLAGGGQAAGGGVHAEEHDGVGILVGGEEVAAGGVEREIARRFALSGYVLDQGERALGGVDRKHGDVVGASIGSVEKPRRAVYLKLGRGTGSGEGRGKGRDLLDLAHGSARGAVGQDRNGGPRLVEIV